MGPWRCCPLPCRQTGHSPLPLICLVGMLTLLLTLFTVVTLFVMRMPGAMTAGALVTTAGAVPTGAGMMMPAREPGGAGTKQPSGPIGRGPRITP